MASKTRKPLGNIHNAGPACKKLRTTSKVSPNTSTNNNKSAGTTAKRPPAVIVPTGSGCEILIKQWLTLPQSQFGIHYELGSTKTYMNPPTLDQNGISILHMAANKCSFELRMQKLRYVLNSKYPTGAPHRSYIWCEDVVSHGGSWI
jgi:hypothetical protein